MDTKPRNMIAPDGGWGWIVVLGVSIVNLCTRSIETSFGLLFGDLLGELGVETTGAAIIMSTLDALINFSGLLVGPLIRATSYRKVSAIGSALVALGLILTSPARSMTHIIATYSIINGLGVGLTASSTFVALNHYFTRRRGQAVGYSLAGTAFGMMLMPQAIRLLLENFGFRGSILILGGSALHALVGSALLQPAEWHFVPEKTPVEEEGVYHQEMETIKETEDEENESLEGHSFLKADVKTLEEMGKVQNAPLSRKATFPRNFSTISFLARKPKDGDETLSLVSSYSRLDVTGSSLHLHLEAPEGEKVQTRDGLYMRRNMTYPGVPLISRHKIVKDFPRPPSPVQEKKKDGTLWQRFVEFMDLDLLKDPIYLNLIFGLSIFYVAEQNFKMVVPFFFSSIGYDKKDQAMFLSVQAATDILARLILPPICDRLTVTKRTLFMGGIFVLGICRSVMAQQTDWTSIMIWLVICGFIRGAALINQAITISEYSSLEKLPAAFGLHMVAKAIFVVAFGPVLGVIRDTTQSYPFCIHSQTFCLMLCCTAWSIEYIIRYFRNKSQSSETESDTTT